MEKKVLSFYEFVLESQNLLQEKEGKGGQGVDENLLIKVLDVEKKIAIGKMPKGKKVEDLQLGHYLRTFAESRDLYDKLPDEDKKKLLKVFQDKAIKNGIDADWINEKLEDYEKDNKLPMNPKIWVTKKETPIPKPAEPEKKEPTEKPIESIDIIPDEDKGSVFQNNMWGFEEENLSKIYTDPEKAKAIKKSIELYVKADYEEKGERIKSILVSSSCSRYRNTEDAEDLSWAELGYKRAKTFTDLFLSTAKELGAGDDYIKKLQSKIKVDYLGTNGDGSSGPDPIGDVKKGYYVNENGKSIWKSKTGTDPLKVMVNTVEIKPEGPVIGKSATAKDAIGLDGNPMKNKPASKEDYDPFRFVEISIETLPLDDTEPTEKPVEPKTAEPEKTVTEKFSFIVILSKAKKRKPGSSISFKFPKFGKSKSRPRKGKHSPVACPIF